MSHQEQTKVSNYAIGRIVEETLLAIWNTFQPIHLAFPTPEEMEISALQFWLKTNFPNAWAALDGKHFEVRNPADAGNTYRCRLGYYSVNLQGI